MKWCLKGGILIDADSGPKKCFLNFLEFQIHRPDTFIEIGSGHTVIKLTKRYKVQPNICGDPKVTDPEFCYWIPTI